MHFIVLFFLVQKFFIARYKNVTMLQKHPKNPPYAQPFWEQFKLCSILLGKGSGCIHHFPVKISLELNKNTETRSGNCLSGPELGIPLLHHLPGKHLQGAGRVRPGKGLHLLGNSGKLGIWKTGNLLAWRLWLRLDLGLLRAIQQLWIN